MHRKGVKCAMSKIQIGAAVLELKRGRILRDYSNESLREAYKNPVFAITFDWNRWQHSLVRMGTPPGPKVPVLAGGPSQEKATQSSAVSRGPGGRLSRADRHFGCAPRPAGASPSEQLDPVSLGARHPIPATPRRQLLAPAHGGGGHSGRLDGGARRAVVRQRFQAGVLARWPQLR